MTAGQEIVLICDTIDKKSCKLESAIFKLGDRERE